MSSHELVLLSPYRYPAQYPLTLADEDMACWLNGYTALWHPAIIGQAQGPPRCDTPYDHDTPHAQCIYVLPESPSAYLPEDWEARVRQAGSLVFHSTPDRAMTLANLRAALHHPDAPALGWKGGLELHEDHLRSYFGLGFGFALLGSLSEAMEHENPLDLVGFWSEVQIAAGLSAGSPADSLRPDSPTIWLEALKVAATRLAKAREVLYPVTIHLLDLHLLQAKNPTLPATLALESGIPCNLIAASSTLAKLAEQEPSRFELLRQAVQAERAEVLGGSYEERPDPLLPLDSQLWNLGQGLKRAKELLGVPIQVYARQRFGFHPHLPLLLTTHGLTRVLFLVFDDVSALPMYTNIVIAWPSPDGKQVDAFTRAPKSAMSADTFFNLGHAWFKTTREDHHATLVLLHGDKPTLPWYGDLLALAQLAPVLGTWTSFSRYFREVLPGEFPSSPAADDFHSDLLNELVTSQEPNPISRFASHQRLRRRLDACWTFAALHRALGGEADSNRAELQALEDELECSLGIEPSALLTKETILTQSLADRLQSRANAKQSGYLLLNPCGFTRRVAVELEGASRPLAIDGAVKACQLDETTLRAVIEVPGLGFVWIPREGPPGTTPMPSRLRLGDQSSLSIRNEFLEAEVDPQTGGLRALRDQRTHVNRIGQQLVFNPGSRMVVRKIRVTSTGPALGEIVSEGDIVGEHNQLLASYKQRLRLWLGRPILEMRIEIEPQQPPAGYAWHSYFGSRFAWRDEREILVRGVVGTSYISKHPRPQTPDFLELRHGTSNTVIFPGGLPFHHRQGGRMVDVILIPEGEKQTVFELGLSIDREIPMQTALGYASPLAVVPTSKGPPHIGSSGWLFHVDASNLLLTRLIPGGMETRTDDDCLPEDRDAITARFLECAGYSGLAEFRCVRDPKRAVVLDARGQYLLQANINSDIVHLEVSPNDLIHVEVNFS